MRREGGRLSSSRSVTTVSPNSKKMRFPLRAANGTWTTAPHPKRRFIIVDIVF